MAHQWRGVIREYADRLPLLEGAPVITLHEGGTPLIEAEQLCLLLGEDRRGDERVVTQAFAGCFEGDAQLRAEFMRAIGGGRV